LAWAICLVSGVTASLPAAAQGVQTAEGAQQFLAEMAQKMPARVHFVDAAGRANYVTGKYTGDVKTIKGGLRKQKETIEPLPEKAVDKQVSDMRASALEAVDAWARPSACATRITEVTAPPYDDVKSDAQNDSRSFSWTVTYTNEYWKYEPLTRFMSPAQVIDWSNARVNRNVDGSVTVTSKGQTFSTIQLTYVPGDPDWADRIEYAMKFLMVSCGGTLSAGL
jgi:hypothetical protein